MCTTKTTPESDLRALARILAPYIADELGLTQEVLAAAAAGRRTNVLTAAQYAAAWDAIVGRTKPARP